LFIALEKEMDVFILEELIRAGNDETTAQLMIDRKASQRNKIYSFRGEAGRPSSNSKHYRDPGVSHFAIIKTLHSIISRVAHKGGMLPLVVEKFRKIASQHGVTSPVIKLEFPILVVPKNQKAMVKIRGPREVSSIYINLAKFVHICYAYHRGVEVFA
jgi:hypothetical protein